MKREVHRQVEFRGGERVAVGLSGGKDSSTTAVLLHEILAPRGDVEVLAITVDEGIASYRPEGIRFAKALCRGLGIEHRVVPFEETVGWTMDEVVAAEPGAIPCSYCGVFRRNALNRAAREAGADYVATGLNLDDTAQSILMNVARGDVDKLARLGPHERPQPGLVPRLQPLRMVPEKEVYSGYDRLRPLFATHFPPPELSECVACGEPTVNLTCKACELQVRLSTPRGRVDREPETVR